MYGQSPGEKRTPKLGDEARFFRSLVSAPRVTGAVAPSGRALARAMAVAVPSAARGLIVELGPGTGPVTKALIERGVAKERLVLIEYNPGFCRMLRERFAPAAIIQGDAYDLPGALADFAGEPIAAVVSSLPLLNQPPQRRERLIGDAFALMGPGGVFVQFTYGLVSPIPRDICASRYSARSSAPIWRNVPPARVWTYRLDAHAGGREAAERIPERKAPRLKLDWARKGARASEALARKVFRDRLARRAMKALENLRGLRENDSRAGRDR